MSKYLSSVEGELCCARNDNHSFPLLGHWNSLLNLTDVSVHKIQKLNNSAHQIIWKEKLEEQQTNRISNVRKRKSLWLVMQVKCDRKRQWTWLLVLNFVVVVLSKYLCPIICTFGLHFSKASLFLIFNLVSFL